MLVVLADRQIPGLTVQLNSRPVRDSVSKTNVGVGELAWVVVFARQSGGSVFGPPELT